MVALPLQKLAGCRSHLRQRRGWSAYPCVRSGFGAHHDRLMPIFPRRQRLQCSRRKTMALKLWMDCGQTRGQYPAPPP